MTGGARWGAAEIARRVRAREVSPREVLEEHLRRIDPAVNAFAHLDPQLGSDLGPLAGVPMTIKSSIDVRGLRSECGTPLRRGYVARRDAPLVARLRRAGATIVGTTNVPDHLLAYETDNYLYGRTNHPLDLSRTPGGSSGGEAAAIAMGAAAAGIGSDGGGSIRVPAHFCGICGLKPTPGRISAAGHYPALAGPFATLGALGPMARRVEDLQLLFEVLAGGRPRRPDLAGWRIGFYDHDGISPPGPATREAVRQAARLLEAAGFIVEEFRPSGLDAAQRAWWAVFGGGAAELLAGVELHPCSRDLLGVPGAQPETFEWRGMDRHRVLLCPVAAIPAFRHGERRWGEVRYREAFSYAQVFNYLGHPAVAVPSGHAEEGMPIGVQVVGRPGEDEVALAVAACLEQTR